MSDEPTDSVQNASENGIAASYPSPPAYPMLVGPATGAEFNVLKDALRPLACCSFDDGCESACNNDPDLGIIGVQP